jgi:hypothetical protein
MRQPSRVPRPLPLIAATLITAAAVTLGHASSPSSQEQAAAPVVLVGAGDIANCDIAGGTGAIATGRLLDQIPGTIFTVGDHAYPSGTEQNFRDCYDPRWGRHKARTRPSPGNHEYLTNHGKAYFDYFGDLAGPDRRGYYSYDLGAWHIISLNSTIDADRRSRQVKWLIDDLQRDHAKCTLAYWHVPLFSSGPHGADMRTSAHMLDVWKLLYEFHADVVVNGHDHDYERFAPQDPNGKADPRGIREFVVGTGGGGLYEFRKPLPNSEARNNRSYGLIKFTLSDSSYTWEYLSAAGEPFKDSGSAECVE